MPQIWFRNNGNIYVLVPQNGRVLVVSFPKKVLGGVDMERDRIVFSKLDEL